MVRVEQWFMVSVRDKCGEAMLRTQSSTIPKTHESVDWTKEFLCPAC